MCQPPPTPPRSGSGHWSCTAGSTENDNSKKNQESVDHHSRFITRCCSRGEGEIEKVFVLDSHCFIRKIEDFVG